MTRLVLLVTSPAVRPGLLSWPAWQLLRGASRVLAGTRDHPLLPALAEAGIGWEVPPGAADSTGLARLLTAAVAGATGDVVWLCPPEPPGRPADAPPGPVALADELGGPDGPRDAAVELVYGSTSLPGGELVTLAAVMDTLRRRCPWDGEQTHESLAPYLIEEAYEALDALESGDRAALRAELGDVLLQVMFHARIAAERADGTGFTVDDVADGIVAKLVRRHPHVFAGVAVSGAEDVTRNWDQIKAAERESATGSQGSALDGVPFGQPALALAAQLQRRAQRAGVPADVVADVPADGVADVPADVVAGRAAADGGGPGAGLGAELLALVARAQAGGLDPELELRAAARRYADRVRAWERAQRAAG